jgi:hypothetical protein
MPIKRRNNLGEVDTISRNEQCFGSRMDPHSIGSVDPGPDSVRLPIQEGKNYIEKKNNIQEISCFEVLDVLF